MITRSELNVLKKARMWWTTHPIRGSAEPLMRMSHVMLEALQKGFKSEEWQAKGKPLERATTSWNYPSLCWAQQIRRVIQHCSCVQACPNDCWHSYKDETESVGCAWESGGYSYMRLELENRGHSGGLRGWKSALEHRLRVQAPGCGSFSPVATFKLCS